MYKFVFLTSVLFVLLASCSRNDFQERIQVSSPSLNALTPVFFEWDKVDYMPTPVGLPKIMVPWASTMNQAFPPEFLTDYSPESGWELVYNTFNTTTLDQPLFFALYNKYRGVLRLFAYLNPVTPIPSNYISHALEMRQPWNSPILNFSSLEIVRADTIQTRGNQIQPYHTSATGTWYGCQFEIAYDPNISMQNAINSMLTWRLNSVAVSEVVLNGVTTGQINGTLSQPASSGSPLAVVGSLIKGAALVASSAGLQKLGLNEGIGKPVFDAFTSAAQGQVKNVMSGIIGSSGTTNHVELKINADHKLTGTTTNNYNINAISLTTPGSINQGNVAGYLPLYNKPMGIFSLRTIPLVKGKYVLRSNPRPTVKRYRVEQAFYLDTNTVIIDFNPTIVNNTPDGVTIRNLKKQLITYAIRENIGIGSKIDDIDLPLPLGNYPIETFNGLNFGVLPFGSTLPQEMIERSIREKDGDRYEYDRLKYLYDQNVERFSIMKNEYLRIIFDVVPNNGRPKTTIVKTFKLKWAGEFEDKS